jgi:Protein of unknown function (DUF1496)
MISLDRQEASLVIGGNKCWWGGKSYSAGAEIEVGGVLYSCGGGVLGVGRHWR